MHTHTHTHCKPNKKCSAAVGMYWTCIYIYVYTCLFMNIDCNKSDLPTSKPGASRNHQNYLKFTAIETLVNTIIWLTTKTLDSKLKLRYLIASLGTDRKI